MPKYTFECPECGKIEQKFAALSTTTAQCGCGSTMKRNLPSIGGPAKVTEKMDDMSNVTHIQDQKEILKERRDDHYWAVEVPKMVNSGIYSAETMFERGWIFINDKGQIEIHTKPPEKR